MKEISNALSDAIFTVCNKIISKAKFDKTYKCRVVSKVSDGKYIVIKDDIEHVVNSVFTYNVGDIVTVLLPQNNWKNATIVYPQDSLDKAVQYVNNVAVPFYQKQTGRGVMNDVCSYQSDTYSTIGTIKIKVPLVWMGQIYVDIWSYYYSGLYIAGGYSYYAEYKWYRPTSSYIVPDNNILPVRFAEDASHNKYILIGTTATEYGGFLGVSIAKLYSNYLVREDISDQFSIEIITDESDLTVTYPTT